MAENNPVDVSPILAWQASNRLRNFLDGATVPSIDHAVMTVPGNHTRLPGIHPAPAPVELPHPYYESPVALGPAHPSKAMGGAIFDQSIGTWRPRTGLDVASKATGLPAGMEGKFIPTPAYAAQLEAEAMPQLTPEDRIASGVYDIVKWAEDAPQNIRDAVTAAWDSAKGWIPRINTKFKVALSLSASAYALAACGGAAPQPVSTPEIRYAATSTAVPTATRIEPTATIFASPTPQATLRPPEIRPSVTPDPNTLSKITFAQLETMPSAAPLIGALRALSDTRLIAANFDVSGRPTFAGVDLSIASQVDAQGKVKAEGSFPYFTVKDGPDTGVVQKGAFYAPAFDAEQNPDGSFVFKFYENEKPVVLLPTTLQKLLGVSDAIQVMPDLKNGRLSVVRLDKDGRPADLVASTSILNFDHLTPDQMVWDKPNNPTPPIKPTAGITPTTGVTDTAPITPGNFITEAVGYQPSILTEIKRAEGVSETTYTLNPRESGGVGQISIANITFKDGMTARPDFTPKAVAGLSDMTLAALVINQSLSATRNLPNPEDMPALLAALKKDIASNKPIELNMVRSASPGTIKLLPYSTRLQPRGGALNVKVVDADNPQDLPPDCDVITTGNNFDGTPLHVIACVGGNTVYLSVDPSNVRPGYDANAGSSIAVMTTWLLGVAESQMALAKVGNVTEARLGKGKSDGGSTFGTRGSNPSSAASDWSAPLQGKEPTEAISKLFPKLETFTHKDKGSYIDDAAFKVR